MRRCKECGTTWTAPVDNCPAGCERSGDMRSEFLDRELADIIERNIAGQRQVPAGWARSVSLFRNQWEAICDALRATPSATALPKAVGVARMHDNDRALLVCLDRKPTDDELRGIHELLAGRMQPEEREPDGYAVVLDDKASAPNGFWIVMAYLSKEVADREAARSKQGQRVVPFRFVQSPQKEHQK